MHLLTFVKATLIPASADELFNWHEAPGAFERLTPPWERVRILSRQGGIRDGATVSLEVGPWPFSMRWDLQHRDYERGRSFSDVQVKGPFRHWKHVHRMISQGPHSSLLEDTIEYALPLGWLGALVGGPIVVRKLRRMFDYRHEVTLGAFAPKMPREHTRTCDSA